MHLTPQDVKRLYGSILFRLPEQVMTAPAAEESAAPQPPAQEPTTRPEPEPAPTDWLTQGSAITWKMRDGARLALVLTQAEFSNRELTGQLKQAVVAAGIAPGEVGFGIYDPQAEAWNFSDMPVPQAVIFGACAGKLTEAVDLDGQKLYPAPLLSGAEVDALSQALRQAQA